MDNRLFSNKQLIRLVIPLAIEQGLAILVGMADSVMVSSAGEAAISGVSLVDMINAIALNLFAALATGGAVVTSQYLGARNMEKAEGLKPSAAFRFFAETEITQPWQPRPDDHCSCRKPCKLCGA